MRSRLPVVRREALAVHIIGGFLLAGCAPESMPESMPESLADSAPDSGQAAGMDRREPDPLLAAPLRAGLSVRALVRVDDAEISAASGRPLAGA